MKIKRFVADDVPAAVLAVRREWGSDAVILATQRRPRPGWRRLFRRFDRMEVTAAMESGRSQLGGGAAARSPALGIGGAWPSPSRPGPLPPAAWPRGVVDRPASIPLPRVDVMERGEPDALRAAIFGRSTAAGGTAGPLPVQPRSGTRAVVVLVGPNGAGKTVTAAKLASQLHLQQGWRVALLSADTFRVGAVEQLAGYARMLSVPFTAVPTPAALERALQQHVDVDVVLVDTTGCCHRDTRRLRELAAYLEVARQAAAAPCCAVPDAWPSFDGVGRGDAARSPSAPVAPAFGGAPGPCAGHHEVHLVLAASTRRAETQAVVAAYQAAGIGAQRGGAARLLLTKLDECEAPPEAMDVAAAAGLPLSYFAFGQRVPEDLGIAWPDRLADVLAGARLVPAT